MAAEYSKLMFLNTHHYSNLGYCSSLLQLIMAYILSGYM